MTSPLRVLYEDNHLLAVFKPAGLATMGVATDSPSLWNLAKEYIKKKYQKPGNVYLGVVSRLDLPTSGVVLFARTSKAAARLTELFRTHRVEKIYWVLAEGVWEPASGTLIHHLAKDETNRRMQIVGASRPGAKQAALQYRRIQIVQKKFSLIEVELQTGRKHQIRLQFAESGHPILGDRKYGSVRSFPQGIALHARRLTLEHPVRKESITFEAPLPDSWRRFGVTETR